MAERNSYALIPISSDTCCFAEGTECNPHNRSGVKWRLGSMEEKCLKRSKAASEVEPRKEAGNSFFHERLKKFVSCGGLTLVGS